MSGTISYPFSKDGIIGLNIVARNIDDPYEDAIDEPATLIMASPSGSADNRLRLICGRPGYFRAERDARQEHCAPAIGGFIMRPL